MTWDTTADLESGLRGFIVLRDGREIGRVLEKLTSCPGRALFQGKSYHDTPEKPLAPMLFTDSRPGPG